MMLPRSQCRPWRAEPRSICVTAARASHDHSEQRQIEPNKNGNGSAHATSTVAPSLARVVASLALGAALAALSAAPTPLPSALAFSGIPEPAAAAPVVTTSSASTYSDDDKNAAPPSDGTLQIKFLASPDPQVREAQTALVEAWGKVSTMYFDHEFGGVDWRGALQEALDDSFRSSSTSSSASSSEAEKEERRKVAIAGTYDAIDAMLSKLGDPYTRVLRPADAGSYVAGAEGEGLSLGMQLSNAPESPSSSSPSPSHATSPPAPLLRPPVVAAVVPDSPAAKAGIAAGDSLLAIDGQTTKGRPIEDLALSLTREADVTFLPRERREEPSSLKGLPPPRTVHLKPASVSLHAVQWAKLKTRGGGGGGGGGGDGSLKVAYVRVAAFNRLAPSDVSRALDSLFRDRSDGVDEKSAPPATLLLDLRDNSGGAVDAGVDVASLLLPRQSAKGDENPPPLFFFGSVRDGAGNEERVQIDASNGKLPAGARLAVLVNGGTASTSELVAAALRGEGSNGKGNDSSSGSSARSNALLVGERTFGKARTQRAVPLTGGGLLLVSNLQYVSPRGESVDGVGLTPGVSCKPEEVARSFFVSGGGAGGDDDDVENENLAEDLLFDPCVRAAAEALGAPLAEPTAAE